MTGTIIFDVDLAYDVKSFVLNNLDDISFSNLDDKKKIFDSDDNDLLRVGKLINSPMSIVSIDKVNKDFFKKNLFKDGNEDSV